MGLTKQQTTTRRRAAASLKAQRRVNAELTRLLDRVVRNLGEVQFQFWLVNKRLDVLEARKRPRR